jgi:hypothetical protein
MAAVAIIGTLSLSGGTALAAPAYTVSYGFDGGLGDLNRDLDGAPRLTVLARDGGTLRTVARDGGDALVFPVVCGGDTCPRVVVETVGDVSVLNPGSRPVSFGATVLLPASQASDGENILQKGYSTTGDGEYKLQVDGDEGKPSCVIVGTGQTTIYVALSTVAIDDGVWHVLACRRNGTTLVITVDGIVRGTRTLPAATWIANTDPLRFGGKGAGGDNDQFHGDLDDAWVTIG